MPGSAAGWVARRLPVADDHHRDELAGSVATVVAERPPCERAWETASLVGLWLRLWARRAVLASGTAALATRGWRASAVVASIGSVVAATVSAAGQ